MRQARDQEARQLLRIDRKSCLRLNDDQNLILAVLAPHSDCGRRGDIRVREHLGFHSDDEMFSPRRRMESLIRSTNSKIARCIANKRVAGVRTTRCARPWPVASAAR
jgi:hypothetical protein